MDKRQITAEQQWVDFIDRERWDLFLTITFRHSKTSFVAKRLFKRFFKHLNTVPNEFFSKYIHCWVFFEKDVYRKGVHIHSLIRGICPSKAALLESKCKSSFGQAKVEPYDSLKGAKYYLAKKYCNNRLDDYDYYKINSAKR